jgi:hypothetical protein
VIGFNALEISRRSWEMALFYCPHVGAARRCSRQRATTTTLTDEGTFTVSGSLVTFTPDNSDPKYTGCVQGRTVIVGDFKIARAKYPLGFAS